MKKAIYVTGVLAALTTVVAHAEKKQPNVVLIVADDHGRDALGCYGNPIIKTPGLDALASEGVRFENAFCTSASSSASRAVLLTGKFGHTIGHYGHEQTYHHFRTFENEKSLPIYLSENGYHTVRIGKYHVAPEKVYHFDQHIPANDRHSVEMAEKCQEVIHGKSPFFLYYCLGDPHRNQHYVDVPYRPNSFGNKEEGYTNTQTIQYNPEEVIVPPFLPDTPECRAELAQYYTSVSRLDQGVAKLIELLKKSGQYENTLIIYLSDNGMAFPGAKTTLYEPGMRLPCIIKEPFNRNRGVVSESYISWVDITPTILAYTDTPLPKDLAGRSLIKDIQNPQLKVNDRIFAAHTFHEITMYYPMRVIREGEYKLIVNFAHYMPYPFASDLWASPTWRSVGLKATSADKRKIHPKPLLTQGSAEFVDDSAPQVIFEDVMNSDILYGKRKLKDYIFRPKFELYNIKNDPDEIVNLAFSTKYKNILEHLFAQLINFQKETKDPWLSKWEYE